MLRGPAGDPLGTENPFILAEREGFEPSVPLPVRQISNLKSASERRSLFWTVQDTKRLCHGNLRHSQARSTVLTFRSRPTNPLPTSKGRSRNGWNGITSSASGIWRKVAASTSGKGRQVYVEGRLRTREFDAKNNGGKRHRTEIIASRVQFLGSPTAEKTEASAIDEPMPPADEVPF
jgi:single-strand DNA-binding protein